MALPFFIISFFNNPVGDDYWITALVREHGYFPAQKILFNTVNPRYSALAISAVSPLTFGNFWLYKVIPLIFILLFWRIIAYLIRSIIQVDASRKDIDFLSAVIIITYLTLMPGMGEGLYWISSLVCYQLGLLFLCLWISLWIRIYTKPGRNILYGLSSCIVLAVMLGFIELLNMIATGSILLVLVYRMYKRKSIGWELIMLVITLFSWYILLSAGSSSRRYFSVIEKREVSLLYATRFAFMQVGYNIVKACVNPFLWIGILLIIAPLKRLLPYLRIYLNWPRKQLYFLIVIWGGSMLMLSLATCYVNEGHIVPLRVTNMIIFIFLMGIIGTGSILFGELLTQEKIGVILRPERMYLAIGVLFLAGIFLTNNYSTATTELVSGKLYRYEKQMQQRYELLQNCKEKLCPIPYLKNLPTTV
ncbi:MAG: hypothetical protein J7578_22390, partial [Chitinophagaceae bacterium]|nr:hypothetical protein [Chitinophagaceae bacterium]